MVFGALKSSLSRSGSASRATGPRVFCAHQNNGGLSNGKLLLAILAALGVLLTMLAVGRHVFVGTGMVTLRSLPRSAKASEGIDLEKRIGEVQHTDTEWKKLLPSESHHVLRESGTERAFTSKLYHEKRKGTYVCAGCGAPLFSSDAKYDSGSGWPSFYQPLEGAVDTTVDESLPFMRPRTEVRCHRCQGHLGHVFEDGPQPTGLRYCMNGVALDFKPDPNQPQDAE